MCIGMGVVPTAGEHHGWWIGIMGCISDLFFCSNASKVTTVLNKHKLRHFERDNDLLGGCTSTLSTGIALDILFKAIWLHCLRNLIFPCCGIGSRHVEYRGGIIRFCMGYAPKLKNHVVYSAGVEHYVGLTAPLCRSSTARNLLLRTAMGIFPFKKHTRPICLP